MKTKMSSAPIAQTMKTHSGSKKPKYLIWSTHLEKNQAIGKLSKISDIPTMARNKEPTVIQI